MLNELASELYRKLSQMNREEPGDVLPQESLELPADPLICSTIAESDWMVLPPITMYSHE